MALNWTEEPDFYRPHPGLEPVSAWQFLRNLSLGKEGAQQFAAIVEADWDKAAKQPLSDTFVALSTARYGEDVLTEDGINRVLSKAQINMSAPRIFIVPLAGRSLPRALEDFGIAKLPRPKKDPVWRGPRSEAIVGIIDHGINFFHHRFRASDGFSRVAYAWSQGGTFDDSTLQVPFGREWRPKDIADAVRKHRRDQDALIRLLDADFSVPGLHPLAFRSTHGTHVLDVAAGAELRNRAARRTPIIAVNLPPEVSRETSGSLLGLFFLQGFSYILARARLIMDSQRKVLPVLVNFSFGLSGGPRGGQHFVEQAMDALIAEHEQLISEADWIRKFDTPLVEVFLPAGNRNMAAGHVGVAGCTELTATWQLQPADRTPNFAEIRVEMPPGLSSPKLQLSLTPPGGAEESTTILAPDRPAKWLQVDGERICRAAIQYGGQEDGKTKENVHVLSLALAETQPKSHLVTPAAAGPWGLRLTVHGNTPKRIDAWILRDDTPPGYRDQGRQSYFIDPDYQDRNQQGHLMHQDPEGTDQGILRAGTLNAIATGTDRQVVGGQIGGQADIRHHEPVPYSANPLPGTSEQITDWAPCERSKVLPGILAAGTRSGTRVAVNGTSVATPQVLRQRLPLDLGD